jgi:carbon-monoxide dehydrogenase small subunit
MNVRFSVNGQQFQLDIEPRRTLADVIRENCRLTGTHLGCEHGVCGACTVLIDDEPVRACLMFAVQADGCSVVTVEGLRGPNGELHPLQEALAAHHGVQCGFCTPGILMTALHLLETHPLADRQTIRRELSSNICRCTGYQSIVDAIEAVARTPYAGTARLSDGEVPGQGPLPPESPLLEIEYTL